MMVPKLRFPEFRDAGGWEQKALNQVCEVNPTAKGLPDSFIYIDLESVEAGTLLKKNLIHLEGAPSRAQRLLKIGDVIFQMVRPYQKNNLIFQMDDEFEYVASTGYAQLRAHQSNTYLYQYIHTDRFVDRVLAKCTGSNYPAINSSDLAEIKVELPTSDEQQKIASFISSIDDLITAQNQKIERLKAHKKGLMQRLFPTDGETIPRLRFPEFRDSGPWELKKLGQLATYTKGFAFRSQDYRENGVRIIRVSDLGTDFIKPKNEKIYIASDSASDYERYVLNAGEIIITTVGSKPEMIDSAVGRGILVNSSNEGLLNQNLLKLEVLSEVNSRFLFSNINTEKYQKFIASISRGNANQANIAVKDLMDFELKVPGSSEQNKIASCLSSIDDLITAQSEKVDALKSYKRGLMQQLFPLANEVDA